jgi:RNA polymerase sigma-70 factor (ECF subfamily)
MALSEIDRNLLDRCLQQKPRAWEDFVDRFIGLITHVVKHTTQSSPESFTSEDYGDFCNEIFLTFIENNFAVLRHFRGQSSLATYLTVVARRKMVKLLNNRMDSVMLTDDVSSFDEDDALNYLYDRDEVENLLSELPPVEAAIVKLFYLEQKQYKEISAELNIPENSIGPILHRARQRLKNR